VIYSDITPKMKMEKLDVINTNINYLKGEDKYGI
jgi:hypothetical protein